MRQTDPALLRSFLHHCLIQFVVVLFSLSSFSISLCFESVYVFAPLFGSLGLSLCMCGCSGVHGCWKCRVLKNKPHTIFHEGSFHVQMLVMGFHKVLCWDLHFLHYFLLP